MKEWFSCISRYKLLILASSSFVYFALLEYMMQLNHLSLRKHPLLHEHLYRLSQQDEMMNFPTISFDKTMDNMRAQSFCGQRKQSRHK